MDQMMPDTALDAPIRRFLAHHRTLGRGYITEEYELRWFQNFLVQVGADDLDQSVFDRWCEHIKPLSANTRRARQRIVRKLCFHRRRTDPTCFVPDPLYFAKPQPYRPPALVTPDQVARMLACVATLCPTPISSASANRRMFAGVWTRGKGRPLFAARRSSTRPVAWYWPISRGRIPLPSPPRGTVARPPSARGDRCPVPCPPRTCPDAVPSRAPHA